MRQLVAQCRSDPELVQNLLYEPQYDDKWKNCYTDVFLVDEGKKIVKPHNRQGWVVPLKNICEKAGIPSNFFTDNRSVTLQEARAHVLRSRLEMISEPSAWLTEHDPLVSKNVDLMSYLASELDPHALQTRLALYNEQTYADRDRIRVAGKCSHFVIDMTTITYNWANACLDQVKNKSLFAASLEAWREGLKS
ncbi:hypothetical protein ANCCAN_28997 [Ancylostoma caninum]|uniref:Uncharacterized protein n=1 Tax=Ancylostoma caninum TaxID=29170 RepID=A0A368EZN1_ANCCA|nr:hypothetical protein ANCCAN_28997 [Ancylostoma caninum]